MITVNNPPVSGTSTASDLALSKHVIASNFVITAGTSAYVTRYVEIADNITLEVGDDADLEIG